jgi:hypothetical protein
MFATLIIQKLILCFSVWKPIGDYTDTAMNWPLALCDLTTVDENDFVLAESISKDGPTENLLAYYRSKYQWYTLQNQSNEEAYVFVVYDSAGKVGGRLTQPKRSLTDFK